MKKQVLLNGIYITVIAMLVFYIRLTGHQKQEPLVIYEPVPGPACNFDTPGYAPALSVNATEANEYTETFSQFASGNGMSILGGVISKAALDSLFCKSNYNALMYSFAIDNSGRVGPSNGIFTIISAANVSGSGEGLTINSSSNFMAVPNAWCPPNCMVIR